MLAYEGAALDRTAEPFIRKNRPTPTAAPSMSMSRSRISLGAVDHHVAERDVGSISAVEAPAQGEGSACGDLALRMVDTLLRRRGEVSDTRRHLAVKGHSPVDVPAARRDHQFHIAKARHGHSKDHLHKNIVYAGRIECEDSSGVRVVALRRCANDLEAADWQEHILGARRILSVADDQRIEIADGGRGRREGRDVKEDPGNGASQ